MFASKLKIPHFKAFRGSVNLPGSKSIANRALLCAALSKGETQISNLPPAEDVEVLLRALKKLGVMVQPGQYPGKNNFMLKSQGGPFTLKARELYLGNAGTALRPLTAILCASPSAHPNGKFVIKGDEQMHRRPIGDLVQALQDMGVDIRCEAKGTPPVEIRSQGLKGGKVELRAEISSQFVSALLLAAPLAKQPLEIKLTGKVTSRPYINLSLDVLQKFGISVEQKSPNHFFVPAPQDYISPGTFFVEGDATAATYFLAAGALPNCGPVRVHGLGSDSMQGDLKFTELLTRMGAHVELEKNAIEVRGPAKKPLKALDLDMNDMPDAAMSLAVLALFCEGSSHIHGIANLRLKESERIHGLKRELEKLGAEVEEEVASLHIHPPQKIRPAVIESYQDHRMAMAFALAAYGTHITIKNPNCVAKTYRGFFADFTRLCLT